MEVKVELENGYLPDRFGKYAPESDRIDGHPNRSFPFALSDIPTETQSLAIEFIDYDSIPVCGFCWIHWTACNIDPSVTEFPEDASRLQSVDMIQGRNSEVSPLAGGYKDPQIVNRYLGPCPPDKDHVYTLKVYALDTMLNLEEGYPLNELRKAMAGHILARATAEIPSRA